MTNDATTYTDRAGKPDVELDNIELAQLIEMMESSMGTLQQGKRRRELQGRIDNARRELAKRGES